MPRRCAATAGVHGSAIVIHLWVVNSGLQKKWFQSSKHTRVSSDTLFGKNSKNLNFKFTSLTIRGVHFKLREKYIHKNKKILFEKRYPHAQLPLLSSWRRRFGGRDCSERYMSGPIGFKIFTRRTIPIDPFWLIVGKKCIVISGCVRCLPAFNGNQIHWGRRDWRRKKRLR